MTATVDLEVAVPTFYEINKERRTSVTQFLGNIGIQKSCDVLGTDLRSFLIGFTIP